MKATQIKTRPSERVRLRRAEASRSAVKVAGGPRTARPTPSERSNRLFLYALYGVLAAGCALFLAIVYFVFAS